MPAKSVKSTSKASKNAAREVLNFTLGLFVPPERHDRNCGRRKEFLRL